MEWYLHTLRRYFDFEGRSGRQEYWTFVLMNIFIAFALGFLQAFFGISFQLVGLFALAMLIPTLALTIRRLHDSNHSGWWTLISLVPFGNLVMFVFMLLDGTHGPNRYGNIPSRMPDSGSRVEPRIRVIDPVEDEIIFPYEQQEPIIEEKQFEQQPDDDVFL